MANDLVPFQAPPPPALIDGRTGRPLREAVDRLTREVSAPTLAGVRSIISGHPAQGLDPVRLAGILRQAETGNAQAYLELAEEMEEKYPHYLSVLGTRKRAVSQLPINVEAASEDAEDEADAQLVRDWLTRLTLQGELFDILDAIGKGYSVTEIVWELTSSSWLPRSLKWRFPQFFEFDQVTGEQLLLKGGEEGNIGLPQPLSPAKYIVHYAQAKSGMPIRGGIARGVAWFYLFTNFTIKDWLTFLEVYGLPLRVGKYANGTSEDDIRLLSRAVAQIGSDAGCVIPESMKLEFITSAAGTANPEMFQRLCTYADDQVSKAVLGQTSSSDAKAGGLGSGQADLHGEVRKDIKDADAAQLSATLTRDVCIPMVMFNRGPRARYPTIRLGEPDVVDVKQALDSMAKGVELGVPIAVSTFRKLTGLPEPKPGEALLIKAPASAPPGAPDDAGGATVPENDPDALLVASKPSKSAKDDRAADAVSGSLRADPNFEIVDALYKPGQPRHPRGSPHGGEWGGGGGIGGIGGIGSRGGVATSPSGGGSGGALTKSESAAVGDYSLMDYKKINEQARGEATYGADVERKIAVMDRAVGKGRLAEDTTLYRGVSGDGVKALTAAGLSEGSVITDGGFLSTSRSKDIVDNNFAEAKGSITIAIAARKGTRALDASKHSNLGFEEEVIFPRSTKLRVVKWDKRKRMLHVEAIDA